MFSGGIFHRNVVLEGVAGIPFFLLLQEFFAGIPRGQEFLYLLWIPPDSGGFWRISVPAKSCWLWPAIKEGSLLSIIWTKIDLCNLSTEQDLTMVSAAPVLCWRLWPEGEGCHSGGGGNARGGRVDGESAGGCRVGGDNFNGGCRQQQQQTTSNNQQ